MNIDEWIDDKLPYLGAVLPHLGAVLGFALAFVLVARLMRQKRRPSNTVAWLLMILLVPYLGVPLYIMFGGRKLSRKTKAKGPLNLLSLDTGNATAPTSPYGITADGNHTKFLHTGVEAFEILIREIQAARTSIDVATFILSRDAIGRRIVRELSAKAKEGVTVRLLIDAIGSFGKKAIFMLELEKAGGRIERFMPVLPITSFWRANLRNHRKICVFDNQKAIVGGRNIGGDYMGPVDSTNRWKDFGLLIEGPAVMPLAAIFEADWAFALSKKGYEPQAVPRTPFAKCNNPTRIEIMASGPDTKEDPIYEKILSVIQETKEHITLVTPYYIPDEVLQRTLIVKARGGRSVTLIVPRRSNHPITDLARDHYLRELNDAGVRVLLYNSGMLHGKVMSADNKIAMTGSANIDLRSLFVNYEVNAFFHTEEIENESLEFDVIYNKPASFTRELAGDLSRLVTPLL